MSETTFEHNITDDQKTCTHVWGEPVYGQWDRLWHRFCTLCEGLEGHV